MLASFIANHPTAALLNDVETELMRLGQYEHAASIKRIADVIADLPLHIIQTFDRVTGEPWTV